MDNTIFFSYFFQNWEVNNEFMQDILSKGWIKTEKIAHGKKVAIQFHQQICAQVYECTQVELKRNFYTVRSMHFAK